MLISKFDLYKHEWLELVFENRNKGYGAYELRQHHAADTIKAMTITFFGVGVLFGASVIFKTTPAPVVQTPIDHTIVVHLAKVEDPKPIPPKPISHPQPPANVATTRFVTPVVVQEQHHTEDMPDVTAITTAVGTTTSKGNGGSNTPVDIGDDLGPATPPVDTKIYTAAGVDVMPEPDGGEAAWSKFLSRNLRYPEQAQDAHVSGKSFISFIVEKDGHLSNFVVERPASYGFDEEAIRVLKLAKAWKPGKQNGQPVRVKYIIPINFQISE